MNEATLKSRIMRELVPYNRFFAIRHEDKMHHGIPDISLTGMKRTSWWEVKYDRPQARFDTPGIQKFTLQKLAIRGYARYIIFHETRDGFKTTHVVNPFRLEEWEGDKSHAEFIIDGFNVTELIGFMIGVHRNDQW